MLYIHAGRGGRIRADDSDSVGALQRIRSDEMKRKKHEKERCAFEGTVKDVYAMAAHHDGTFDRNELLDVSDRQTGGRDDVRVRHHLCGGRRYPVFPQPFFDSGRYDPVLDPV